MKVVMREAQGQRGFRILTLHDPATAATAEETTIQLTEDQIYTISITILGSGEEEEVALIVEEHVALFEGSEE